VSARLRSAPLLPAAAPPASLRAAIDCLAAWRGRRCLILGDMAELGGASAELHAEIGRAARQAGIERMFCVGEQATAAAEAFGSGATHFAELDALIDAVRASLDADTAVLVKGSRSMGLERAVAALAGNGEV